MKKMEAGSENRKVRTEVIKPVVQRELDLIRNVYDDGAVVYRAENDKDGLYAPIETDDKNLDDVICRPLEKMEALGNLLDDEYWAEIGFIMESIINETKQQYEELFDHLERELGIIRVDTVSRGQAPYRAGRIAGIRVVPPKKEGQEAA